MPLLPGLGLGLAYTSHVFTCHVDETRHSAFVVPCVTCMTLHQKPSSFSVYNIEITGSSQGIYETRQSHTNKLHTYQRK